MCLHRCTASADEGGGFNRVFPSASLQDVWIVWNSLNPATKHSPGNTAVSVTVPTVNPVQSAGDVRRRNPSRLRPLPGAICMRGSVRGGGVGGWTPPEESVKAAKWLVRASGR